MLVNSHNKIGQQFFKKPSYSNEPYDAQKRLANTARLEHYQKIG